MSLAYLVTWMMVFLRAIGLILQLPVLAGHALPVTVRVGLCVGLATLLVGVVPAADLALNGWDLAWAAAGEIFLGLLLGFILRLTFVAVDMAGRAISSEIGLTATPGLGVPEPAMEPVASLLASFAVLMFFLLGAHRTMLTGFAKSFIIQAPGHVTFGALSSAALITATSRVLEVGLRIAAPYIAMNFLVSMAFAVLSRAVPKMNVFIVSASARAVLGLGLLSSAGALLARYLYVEFADAPFRMLQVIAR